MKIIPEEKLVKINLFNQSLLFETQSHLNLQQRISQLVGCGEVRELKLLQGSASLHAKVLFPNLLFKTLAEKKLFNTLGELAILVTDTLRQEHWPASV